MLLMLAQVRPCARAVTSTYRAMRGPSVQGQMYTSLALLDPMPAHRKLVAVD
jgi:hypothetical protein